MNNQYFNERLKHYLEHAEKLEHLKNSADVQTQKSKLLTDLDNLKTIYDPSQNIDKTVQIRVLMAQILTTKANSSDEYKKAFDLLDQAYLDSRNLKNFLNDQGYKGDFPLNEQVFYVFLMLIWNYFPNYLKILFSVSGEINYKYLQAEQICDIAFALYWLEDYDEKIENFLKYLHECDEVSEEIKIKTKRMYALLLLRSEERKSEGEERLEALYNELKESHYSKHFINVCFDLVGNLISKIYNEPCEYNNERCKKNHFICFNVDNPISKDRLDNINNKLSVIAAHYDNFNPLHNIRYFLFKAHHCYLKGDDSSCSDYLKKIARCLETRDFFENGIGVTERFYLVQNLADASFLAYNYLSSDESWETLYTKYGKAIFKSFFLSISSEHDRFNKQIEVFLHNLLAKATKENKHAIVLNLFPYWHGWLAKLYNLSDSVASIAPDLVTLIRKWLISRLAGSESWEQVSPLQENQQYIELISQFENKISNKDLDFGKTLDTLIETGYFDVETISLSQSEVAIYLICDRDGDYLAILTKKEAIKRIEIDIKKKEETKEDWAQGFVSIFWESLRRELDNVQTMHIIVNGRANFIPFDLGKPEKIVLYYYPTPYHFESYRKKAKSDKPPSSYPQKIVFYNETFYGDGESKEGILVFTNAERYCIQHEKIAGNTCIYLKPDQWNFAEDSCLHIASHGGERPFVHIKLLKEEKLLGSYEFLRNKSLEGKVIFLAGCVTGHLNEKKGEPLGIVPALLALGARYVIGYLIPTRDELAALSSILFHYNWKQGATPDIALKLTKEQLKTGKWPQKIIHIIQDGFTKAWEDYIDHIIDCTHLKIIVQGLNKIYAELDSLQYKIELNEDKLEWLEDILEVLQSTLKLFKDKLVDEKGLEYILEVLQSNKKQMIDILVSGIIENGNLEGIDQHITWLRGFGGPYQNK